MNKKYKIIGAFSIISIVLGAFILKLYNSIEVELRYIINKSYKEFIDLENDDSKGVGDHYKKILDDEFEKINNSKKKINDDKLKSILDDYLNNIRLFENAYDELYSENFNKEKTNIDELLYEANSKKYSVLTTLKENYNVKISEDLYENIQRALKEKEANELLFLVLFNNYRIG